MQPFWSVYYQLFFIASSIGSWLYASFKSVVLNTSPPLSLANTSLIFGDGYCSVWYAVFTVIPKSAHRRMDPSFLITAIRGAVPLGVSKCPCQSTLRLLHLQTLVACMVQNGPYRIMVRLSHTTVNKPDNPWSIVALVQTNRHIFF